MAGFKAISSRHLFLRIKFLTLWCLVKPTDPKKTKKHWQGTNIFGAVCLGSPGGEFRWKRSGKWKFSLKVKVHAIS